MKIDDIAARLTQRASVIHRTVPSSTVSLPYSIDSSDTVPAPTVSASREASSIAIPKLPFPFALSGVPTLSDRHQDPEMVSNRQVTVPTAVPARSGTVPHTTVSQKCQRILRNAVEPELK